MGRKRILAGVAAIVLAAVATVVLYGFVQSAEERALEGEELVDVLVIDGDVPEGTSAAELGDLVRIEQVPRKVQADGALIDLTDVEGLVTATNLVEGEQVVAERFVQPDVLTRQGIQAPPGLLEMTVSLSPDRAVGGTLVPGDTVAVVSSFDPFDIEASPGLPGEEIGVGDENGETEPPQLAVIDGQVVVDQQKTPNVSHIILHKVLVTNVQLEELPEASTLDEDDENAPSNPRALAPTGNLLVTLALDAPSIERLAFTAEFGYIFLALEPGDASEAGTQIQNRGTIYIPTNGTFAR